MSCTAERHDTVTAYRHYGCRCDDARRAHLRSQKRWKLRTLRHGPLLIDATGTLRRLRALRRMGYALSDLAPHLGVTTKQRVSQIGTQAQGRVHRDMAIRVQEVYDRLSMTHGPDLRARLYAEKMGWPPPLAWDDETIDDPNARPQRNPRVGELRYVDEVAVEEAIAGRRPRLTTLERREAVARMTDRGMTAAQVADVLGLSTKSIDRIRARAAEGLTQGVADACKAGHWYGDEGVLGRDRRGDRYCRVCKPNVTSHAA